MYLYIQTVLALSLLLADHPADLLLLVCQCLGGLRSLTTISKESYHVADCETRTVVASCQHDAS